MTENENGFVPEDERNSGIDITQEFLDLDDAEFMEILSQYNGEADTLALYLHIADADPKRIGIVMSKFPKAKVVIATTRENYQLDKDKFQGNIDWKFIS